MAHFPHYALQYIATVRRETLVHKTILIFAGCKTRYYHNYSVQGASKIDSIREYYECAIPAYIEITDHVYVDHDFCKWVQVEIAINT